MAVVTWDTINKGTGVTLSNGNLTVVIPNSTNSVKASIGKTTGKWYWEVRLDAVVTGTSLMVGIVNSLANMNVANFGTQNGRYYYGANGFKWSNTGVAYGSVYAVGDTIGVALDLDGGTLEFYKNGVNQGIAYTDVFGMGEVFASVGNGSTYVQTSTVNFGATPFTHPIPSGYTRYYTPPLNKILLLGDDGEVSSFGENKYSDNLIPKMTSNILPKGVVSVSGNNGVTYDGWRSFDGITNGSNTWIANQAKNVWISYEFEKPTCVNKYSVYPRDSTLTASPKDWVLEGSNDIEKWTILDKQLEVTGWELNKAKYFEFNNNQPYKKYRMYIYNNSSNSLVTVGEIEMYYKEPPVIRRLVSQSEQSFINYGIPQSDLASIDMSADFTGKHYIQDTSTVLGSGKVFEQTLDTNKVLKKISVK